ncbi:WD40/YVTN/BNR-like repeat-containing protein [Parvibaculum sp.]|uniref:WD40/YVTN/BNR-like repeat-containing protein n=1 Tax=Parvibaculum sp. TaxID=2024848 RepID=UPI003BAC8F58
MKKFSILVLVSLLLPAIAQAAPDGSSLRYQGTPHDALFDIAFDGSHGLAVGGGGTVLESTDGGLSWTAGARPDTELALLGVAFQGQRRFLVSQSGKMFRYESGRWVEFDSGTDARLFQVALGGNGLVVAVGGFGAILVSRDDGRTWSSPEFDWMEILDDYVEPHLYAVDVTGDRITVAGEFGLILQSPDRGAKWSVVRRGVESIFDFTIDTKGEGLAVGQDGLVLGTSDGGRSWTKHAEPGETNLLGIWRSGSRAFAAGIRGAYASHDGGKTWKPVTRSDIETGWYQAVASSVARDKPMLVGHRGRILEMDE